MAKLTGLSDSLGKSAAKTRNVITDGAKKAADSVKKAANEAKRSLAAFDQINNLTTASKTKTGRTNKKKGTSGSTSGSEGGDGESDSDGPAGSAGKQSGGALQKAAEKLKGIFGPSINRLKSNTKRLIDDIAGSIKKVALNGTGLKTLRLMAGIINGIFGTIANIAGALAKAWEHNETGTKIIQHLWDILNSILKVILSIVSAVEKMTGRLNLNQLLEAVEYILKYAALVIGDIAGGVSKMFNLIASGKWGEAGKALSDGIKKALADISGFFKNADWQAIGKIITDAIVGALNAIGDFASHIDWGGLASGLLNVLWNVVQLGSLWKRHEKRLIKWTFLLQSKHF